MRKIFLVVAVVMATMLAFNVAGSGAVAVSSGMEAVQAGDDDSSDGKEKKKKEKKKKKKKEKTPKTAEEIIALLQGLEWKKPAKSGLEVDKYYDEADEFFKMLKTVADSVTIYKPMKVVTPSGKTEIVPVDAAGNVRHKNEAFDQVMESVSYGISLTTRSTLLAAETLVHAVQIGQDAIPLLGNSERKAANVQIAKATKAFPLLKQLMDSQRSMAKRYFRPANVEVNDSVDEAIVSDDVDFMETMEMTDEELDAYISAEQAGV